MSEQLLKKFAIAVQEKLYEKNTPKGKIAVYQTSPFGKVLTLDDLILVSEADGFFYHEMMTHPALFSHHAPLKVAVLGDAAGILQEVVKHATIREIHWIDTNPDLKAVMTDYFIPEQTDQRVSYRALDAETWLAECEAASFDIIFQTDKVANYHHYARALKHDGILVQPFLNAYQSDSLKALHQQIHQAGFHEWQLLNFHQPSYFSGMRTLLMATKRQGFKRVREKEIFNRPFQTHYYNYDVHKAALSMPEFMRVEWEKIS